MGWCLFAFKMKETKCSVMKKQYISIHLMWGKWGPCMRYLSQVAIKQIHIFLLCYKE